MEGLKANTEYSFSLAAISNKGIGAFTNELVQRTSQASTSQFDWGHIHRSHNIQLCYTCYVIISQTHFMPMFCPLHTDSLRYIVLVKPGNHLCLSSSILFINPSVQPPLPSIYLRLTVPFLLAPASRFLTQPKHHDRWRWSTD